MSALEGNPEDICSDWVLLSLTRRRHQQAGFQKGSGSVLVGAPIGLTVPHVGVDEVIASAVCCGRTLVAIGTNATWRRAQGTSVYQRRPEVFGARSK